jgi:DNA-binding MarR family transcriptional regulator
MTIADIGTAMNALDKAFNNRIRLGIMSAVLRHEGIDFNALKDMLELTDGNLASHTAALEKYDYLRIKKRFIGKRPNTTYFLTAQGKQAYIEHLKELRRLIALSIETENT